MTFPMGRPDGRDRGRRDARALTPPSACCAALVAVVAAQRDMPSDRLVEALLVAELVARNALRYLTGDHAQREHRRRGHGLRAARRPARGGRRRGRGGRLRRAGGGPGDRPAGRQHRHRGRQRSRAPDRATSADLRRVGHDVELLSAPVSSNTRATRRGPWTTTSRRPASPSSSFSCSSRRRPLESRKRDLAQVDRHGAVRPVRSPRAAAHPPPRRWTGRSRRVSDASCPNGSSARVQVEQAQAGREAYSERGLPGSELDRLLRSRHPGLQLARPLELGVQLARRAAGPCS